MQVRCPLFDEVLHTLWDHYYVFMYGSIRALTDAHTLVDEQFCLLIATAVDSLMHLLPVFDHTSHERGEEGERVLLQQYRLHRVHTVILCG